jgi:hypothetical protein
MRECHGEPGLPGREEDIGMGKKRQGRKGASAPTDIRDLRRKLRKAERRLEEAEARRDRAQARVAAMSIIADEIRATIGSLDGAGDDGSGLDAASDRVVELAAPGSVQAAGRKRAPKAAPPDGSAPDGTASGATAPDDRGEEPAPTGA